VNDGGVGIRFNSREWAGSVPISWAEWLEHFDRHGFDVRYQEESPIVLRPLAEPRREHGHDRQDWFDASNSCDRSPTGARGRYWFVQWTPTRKNDASRRRRLR
jgi:hypothetical protein